MSGSTNEAVLDRLLQSEEPSVVWKTRVNVLGESRDSSDIRALEDLVRDSPRAEALTQDLAAPPSPEPEAVTDIYDPGNLRFAEGAGPVPVYSKWQGAQWVLMTLADIGYPPGDDRLRPAADEMVDMWLGPRFYNEFEADSKAQVYSKIQTGIPLMEGRYRTCASQQGNALYSVLTLGLDDERIHDLVERLLFWQWPDGGWNCDKNPSADSSTFIHTLWAMRGLALYADRTGNQDAADAVESASEVFLRRHLYKRASNGKVIRESFTKLHYPLYWHYDILGALKVFAEAGMTEDERLGDAVDLLESKAFPDGGWPAEARYYERTSNEVSRGTDYVSWGGVSKKKMNEWVTVDALYVLTKFGRT